LSYFSVFKVKPFFLFEVDFKEDIFLERVDAQMLANLGGWVHVEDVGMVD
jgi:hypothetical protein